MKPRDQSGYDPVYKVQPILSSLTAKFQNVYAPQEFLTIDEAICAFWGTLTFSSI
jgi:hypothetical protein